MREGGGEVIFNGNQGTGEEHPKATLDRLNEEL